MRTDTNRTEGSGSEKGNRQPAVFSRQQAVLGKTVAWSVSFVIVVYLITLVLGFVSLESPDEPIGNPWFTILEVLIILLSPLMVFCLVLVHRATPGTLKQFSLTALLFMAIMSAITCTLHFTILALSRHEAFSSQEWQSLVFAFTWPSVAYTADILAWDFFYALAVLFLAAAFREKGFERRVQLSLIASGVLSLIGLAGIPLNNMQVRNIGILGYTAGAIIAFYLLGLAFSRRVQ